MADNLPSKKQRELLNFIENFIKGNGYSPTYREIMRGLGYKSVSTVAIHVDNLIAKGFLVKKDNSARSIEVAVSSRSVGAATSVKSVDVAAAIDEKLSADQLPHEDKEALLRVKKMFSPAA